MPRVPLHAVAWSPIEKLYDLATGGHVEGHVRLDDGEAWWAWLGGAMSFAFHGASGSLNVYHEARRGKRYWYAYHTAGGRTRKQYLGQAATVSLARLEEVAATLARRPASAPRTTMREGQFADVVATLPTTKLSPPRSPLALVSREHLLADLDGAFSTPLTLVAAAAGWGKTTLLATWASRHPRRVAWLSLDASDDDPSRFWIAVIAALRTRMSGIGALAHAMLRSPQPPPIAAIVASLLNDLDAAAGQGETILLLLDDYQVIGDHAIHESLRFFLEHLPACMHLLISSRVDPDFPLARLRVRGQLTELRAADLRFTHEDTDVFLRQALGFPLMGEAVFALERRTEGWIAGLQLAALALRGRDDPAAWLTGFTGGHRYLLDYIEDEILARQPPAIRRFLLWAAILPRLGVGLCAAVTGEEASGAILRELARQNLFLIPLDEEWRWYRLHDLFREALLAHAADVPDLLPEAHRRAANWHAEHGDGREAVSHALAAGDYPLAGDLIAREAPHLWLVGEARAVLTWLLALPDDALRQHARLALDTALRLLESVSGATGAFYAGVQMRVEQMLERIEAGLALRGGVALPEAEKALLRGRLRLLRVLIETRTPLHCGDEVALGRLAWEADALAEAEEVRWQMVAHAITYWLVEALQRDGGLLIARLLVAKGRATDAGDNLATSRVLRWLAYADGRAGRPRAAYREAFEGLVLMERRGEHSASAAYLHFLCARVCYEWNRLDEAADSLRQAQLLARTWQNADLLIFGEMEMARLALARGDLSNARHALERSEVLARQERFEGHAPWVDAERVRYWLVAGDLPAAWNWAVRTGFAAAPFDRNRCTQALAFVRVLLAHGRYPEALETLERFGPHLDRPGDGSTAVEFLALRLVALHGGGEHAQARAVAARLFALTEPEGHLRVYLDAGTPMEHAFRSLLAAPDDESPDTPALPRAYIAHLLAAFREERRAAPPPSPTGESSAAAALIEPLTRREREVLAYLADGASNREIADALSLSVNTVKRHVGGLLGKLGATSRTGAVARARTANLL